MMLFQDGLLAFFSAVGATTVVWLVAGALLHAGRPVIPGVLLVLPVRGEALAMEADVRELRRARNHLPGRRSSWRTADSATTPRRWQPASRTGARTWSWWTGPNFMWNRGTRGPWRN